MLRFWNRIGEKCRKYLGLFKKNEVNFSETSRCDQVMPIYLNVRIFSRKLVKQDDINTTQLRVLIYFVPQKSAFSM